MKYEHEQRLGAFKHTSENQAATPLSPMNTNRTVHQPKALRGGGGRSSMYITVDELNTEAVKETSTNSPDPKISVLSRILGGKK